MKIQTRWEQHKLLWIGLAAFAFVILFINPVREAAMSDDWAYALMVKRLLETGEYYLHDWPAANMPFQILWGSLFARVGGYSFSSLRLSTLALTGIGLLAFYGLAQEHGLNRTQAGLVTLGMLASPLVVLLSFSFLTDVPFLACLIIALFLYTRAIRLRHYPLMLLASVAASAAVLTRQFGLAFVPAVLLVWSFGKERKRQAFFFLSGVILPTLASVWQLATEVLFPNWTAPIRAYEQSLYLRNWPMLLENLFWRPAMLLHYLALFSLPFLGVALLSWAIWLRTGLPGNLKRLYKLNIALPIGLALYIAAATLGGSFVFKLSALMPYLMWYFDFMRKGVLFNTALTLITGIGAVWLAYVFVLRYTRQWKGLAPEERLLDLVTLFLLVLHLLYFQFRDRYLLLFLPYALIVLGYHLRDELSRHKTIVAMVCLGMLLMWAMWTRGALTEAEAMWRGGEMVRAAGIAPRQINSDWTWNCYYTFQDYMASIGHRKMVSLDDYGLWLQEGERQAQFLVRPEAGAPVGQGWQVAARIPYQDAFFREKHVYILRRAPQ
jgi:4-amino-4-deoxy-L-arabinose transferase-like glycosyltransferase